MARRKRATKAVAKQKKSESYLQKSPEEVQEIIKQWQAVLEEMQKDQANAVSLLDEAERERQHLADLERIRGFRLMDDTFMNVCFEENVEGTQLVLQIILGRPDIQVVKVSIQKAMKNLLGRDVWLDIVATDEEGKEFDVEVQRSNEGASFRRARYHASIMDAHSLRHGDDFSELPEAFVIMITENDVIGRGESLYPVERRITNVDLPFDDGSHIIYVNGANTDVSTELGKLMHDFSCSDPDKMYFKVLADKVRYFKEDERGVKKMCKVMEDMREELTQYITKKVEAETTKRVEAETTKRVEAETTKRVEAETTRKVSWETKAASVRRWHAMGLPLDTIAQGEGLTMAEVMAIVSSVQA